MHAISLILPLCFLSDFLKFRYKLLVTFFFQKKKIPIPGLDFKHERGRTGFQGSCSSESPTTGCGCWASALLFPFRLSLSSPHLLPGHYPAMESCALILPGCQLASPPSGSPGGPGELCVPALLSWGTEQGQALSLLILNS